MSLKSQPILKVILYMSNNLVLFLFSDLRSTFFYTQVLLCLSSPPKDSTLILIQLGYCFPLWKRSHDCVWQLQFFSTFRCAGGEKAMNNSGLAGCSSLSTVKKLPGWYTFISIHSSTTQISWINIKDIHKRNHFSIPLASSPNNK